MNTKINLGLISAAFYASFQVIANILSTKIAILPFIGLTVDGGTIIYPLTFTLRDFVHKTCGKKNARAVVVISGFISLLAAVCFWLVGKMQPDAAWQFQQSYAAILMPVARITIASIIAQVFSELVDTEVFSLIYKKFNDIAGVFLSNFAALIFDSFIFCFIAFFGVLPLGTVVSIIFSNILIKLAFSAVSAPAIKLIPRTVEFKEI